MMMLFPPKPFRDVFRMTVAVTIKPLVGGAGTQAAELFLIPADFNIVKQFRIVRQSVVA